MVGVTGSIAAYKTATLVRALVRKGAEVKVVMTDKAKEFITPLTLATLAKNPVLVDFFDPTDGRWNSHVSLGEWSDLYLIAPATANTLAKMADGVADNLVCTTYLSAKCPVWVAPAMDLDMYRHAATQRTLERLRQDGVHIIEPTDGELASGLVGKGRMEEPERIADAVEAFFAQGQPLSGKTVLITAGPTYEKIDPVRFIGNYSSGKMGFCLAEACANRGARVELISGPTALSPQHPAIHLTRIESADEMLQAAQAIFPKADICIMSAAVADFKPVSTAASKIKRKDSRLQLELQPNPDIAATLAKLKRPGQITVGFALETDHEETNALDKMARKQLDYIVLNSLKNANSCFGYDTNMVTIYDNKGGKTAYTLKSKAEVAEDILNTLLK